MRPRSPQETSRCPQRIQQPPFTVHGLTPTTPNHHILFAQLKERFDDGRLLDLLWQYLRRTVYDNGLYEAVEQGISLGCPLSPLMGALFLDVLELHGRLGGAGAVAMEAAKSNRSRESDIG